MTKTKWPTYELFLTTCFGLLFLVFQVACTRKAESSNSKLVIQFPDSSISTVPIQKQSTRTISSKPNFDTSNPPSNYDNIDCLLIFIGGPEDTMQNNYCEKQEDKSNHFTFGVFAGSVAKGENITLDVPSGSSRYVRLYGMKKPASATSCPQVAGASNVDNLLNGFSPPYFIGETGNIQMPPGKDITVNVSILAAIDSTAYFNNCKGPQMGDGGNGGGGGTSDPHSNSPYLRLEGLYSFGHFENGSHLTLKPITIGSCLPVSLKTYLSDGSGQSPAYPLKNALTITLPNQSDVVFYAEDSTCTVPGAIISSLTLPTGSSANSGTLFMKVKNTALAQYDFQFPLSTTEVQYNSDGAFPTGKPILKFNLPNTLANNVCYPFKVQSFEADGTTPLVNSGNINLTISSGSIYSAKTNRETCNAGSGVTFASFGGFETGINYFQTPASGPFTRNLSITGPAPVLSTYTIINAATANAVIGDVLPTSFLFLMDPNLEVGKCAKVTVKLMNQSGLNVPVFNPTGISIKLHLANKLKGVFYNLPDCGGSTDIIVLNDGDYSKTFYFKPSSLDVGIQISATSDFLSLKGLGPNFSIGNSAANSIYFGSLPDFGNAGYIGSHEFVNGGTLPVTLAVPTGATIDCFKESNGSSCNALMSGNVFNWSYNEAKLFTSYRFTSKFNGSYQDIRFSPFEIYGAVAFLDCDHVFSGAVAQTSLTSVGGRVNCLASNSTVTLGATNLDIGGLKIVGTADKTVTFFEYGAFRTIIYDAIAPALVANIKFVTNSSSTGGYIFEINGLTNTAEINNSHFHLDASSTVNRGISIYNSLGSVFVNGVTMNVSAGGTTGSTFYVYNSSNVSITNMSMTVSGNNFYGIDLDGGAARDAQIVSLKGFKYIGSGGRPLQLYAVGPTYYSRILDASELDISSSAVSSPAIMLQGYSSLNLKDSFLEKTQNNLVISINDPTSSISMFRNILVQNYDYYGIATFKGVISEFLDNQFLKMNGSSSFYPPIIASGSGPFSSLNSTLPDSNLYCSDLASYAWDLGAKVNGTITGSLSGNNSQPTYAGSQYVSSLHCTYRN